MSEQRSNRKGAPPHVSVSEPLSNGRDWQELTLPGNAEETFPPLGRPAARPVARDRWERVKSSHDIPAAPETVWRALTEPESLRHWLAVCRGSLVEDGGECLLDFEDGEFFLCYPSEAEAPHRLVYFWRWLGIGPPRSVTWELAPVAGGTRVTVTEQATNPPRDWQTWHGDGWPGILDQFASHVRFPNSGVVWRWPWRRMGPYAIIELSSNVYESWDRLFSRSGLKYWLLAASGDLSPGHSLPIMIGDASGSVEMLVRDVVQPGQSPPSFLPHVDFSLKRSAWPTELGGRVWLEPAGLESSILQVFMYGWENVPPEWQLPDRKILCNFWADAFRRASFRCGFMRPPHLMDGGDDEVC